MSQEKPGRMINEWQIITSIIKLLLFESINVFFFYFIRGWRRVLEFWTKESHFQQYLFDLNPIRITINQPILNILAWVIKRNKMKSLQNTSKSEPKEFQHSFQPIYYFSRVIGLWPFSITYNSNGTITARVRPLDSLWFIVSICLYLAALFYACKNIKNTQTENVSYFLSVLISSMSQIPPLLFGPASIVLDMFNRDRLANIFNKCIVFDKEVGFGLV